MDHAVKQVPNIASTTKAEVGALKTKRAHDDSDDDENASGSDAGSEVSDDNEDSGNSEAGNEQREEHGMMLEFLLTLLMC